MIKKLSVVALSLALAACSCNSRVDELEAKLEATATVAHQAAVAANRADNTANAALNQAAQAERIANDAVEAVSRMAEKCCRK